MDKDFCYPIFWKGGLYSSRTRLGNNDYLLLKDDNGNLFNVPASEVSETDEIFDAECAADAKVMEEYYAREEQLRQAAGTTNASYHGQGVITFPCAEDSD